MANAGLGSIGPRGGGDAHTEGMDDETTGRRSRKSPWQRVGSVLGTATVLLLLVGGYFGYAAFTGPSLEGEVLLHENDTVELGPNGWGAVTEDASWWPWSNDRELVLHNLVTGEETTFPDNPSVGLVLPGGGLLSSSGGIGIHGPAGEQIAYLDGEQIGQGVEGLEGLQAGFPEIAGASETTVAVLVCYAQERELLSSEASGGHAVMAGFRLSDGERVWAQDTGAGCVGRELYRPPVSALGAIEHVVTYAGDRATVTRIDDGTAGATWPDAPRDSVVLQDGLALHRSGSSVVEVVDLETGDVLAETECPDVGMMSPGPMANLSTEAVLAIECGDEEARLYDREAQEFTTVSAPPLTEGRLIPDGASRAYDMYILSRDGETVTITDALSGTEIGSFVAPEEMEIQTNLLRGRVMVMYVQTDFEDVHYDVVAVDLRTAEVLISDTEKIGPFWQVDPAGYAMVSSGDMYDSGGRYSSEQEYRVESWVVGVEGTSTDG